MMRQLIITTLSVMIVSLIPGCGFQLRGSTPAPKALSKLFVAYTANVTSDFEHELQTLLTDMHIQLQSKVDKQTTTLKIMTASFVVNQPPLQTTARPITYTYRYTLRYQLIRPSGKPATPVRQIVETSSMVTLPSQILSTSGEGQRHAQLRHAVLNRLYEELVSTYMDKQLKSAP